MAQTPPLPLPRETRLLDASDSATAEAARLLAAGGLVAFPTETVYGLGADAADPRAVAALYAAKGRPAFNPLIAHVRDADAAARIAALGPDGDLLAARFWPGPLTLVAGYQGGAAVCELARAGLSTVAVRVPAHPAAQALLKTFGGAVVAPSANRSGRVSPTLAEHVMADLSGRIDAVLDGGATPVGVESTIVDVSGPSPVLLRPGGVPREALEQALSRPLDRPPPGAHGETLAPTAPGQLSSHYAPRARVRLDAAHVEPGEALLTFAGAAPPGTAAAGAVFDLSPSGDLSEAAGHLYGALRQLDATGAPAIAVVKLPRHGLGEAIADRLARAAAPRPQTG